jgi:protein SERAC1
MNPERHNLLASLQKLASLIIPKGALQGESALLSVLEEESETLRTSQTNSLPLMSNFRIFLFWEQERTELKYTKDFIVNEISAAPILDSTESVRHCSRPQTTLQV